MQVNLKKTVTAGMLAIAICLAPFTTGCSIGGPDEATQHVIDLISDIGDVSLGSAPVVEKALDAYNDLDERQQSKVENQNELKAAEKKLDELTAATVNEQIASIGEVTLEKEAAIVDARNAYNELSVKQQKLVGLTDILDNAEKQLDELKKQFAVGQSVKTEQWNITLTSATVSDKLESDKSRTYWTTEDGHAFLVLEFDVTALTSDKLPVDDYAITDLVANYEGNDYTDWTMQYIANEIWLHYSHTYLDANLPDHAFVYTYVPEKAISEGSLSVDLTLGGEEKTIVIR